MEKQGHFNQLFVKNEGLLTDKITDAIMPLRWNTMKMDALAHASINQLALISLRLEPCSVKAEHRYIMQPAPVERFIYITKGSVCFFLENGEMHANEWDMVYLPRDTAYHSKWLSDANYVVVDLLLRDADGQEIRFADTPSVLFHDAHHVYDGLLTELAEKAEADGPFDWLERMSLSFKLLCEMARDTNRTEMDENYSRIKQAVTYLESNYASDFSVLTLAKMCSLSDASFRRLFLECKGMSPVDYRNRLRIRRAAELLKTGRYTVGEAAEQVGISDIKYFGKLFKRYTGLNPSMLKKASQEAQDQKK